jgi:RNA polymerase sigma-70 factor (ECF subfamily)
MARASALPEAGVALEKLCRTYWPPLYSFARRQGHQPHDAQDLTQEFFARLLEKDYLASVERERGKFRSFLLAAFKHFLSHQRERANAAKRGGGHQFLSLDETVAEAAYSLDSGRQSSPEAAFERHWAITLLEKAFARVREDFVAAGKEPMFDHLKPFLEGATAGDYAAVAAKLNLTTNAIAVAAHRLRQKFRDAVRLEVANTVSSPDQIEEEMRHLFAALKQ